MDPNAEGQDAPDSEALVKVDGLWFTTDTIIVIRVENKIFRVSGGILAARSTVFNDMIAFPQPESGETETMDGSPVVRLHDSAEDVEAFLRAIYDSRRAPRILRLSHKYGCQYLHRRALEHLIADGWYGRNYDDDSLEHLSYGIPKFSPAHSLWVVHAAIEVGAVWLLPYAYYVLSTYSSAELLPLLEGSMGSHVGKALAAHTHLVRATRACDTPERCNPARSAALANLLRKLSDPELNPIPSTVVQIVMDDLESLGACSVCRETPKKQVHEAASAFWDELPSIFGLPPWDTLHAMKRQQWARMRSKTLKTNYMYIPSFKSPAQGN
ncbi:hypothetical protein B0H14DRAFT_3123697 [Mycena olivaceomarginata]|nr:hypothetical protein B0H14DRAFT_3123697 [Mycena olivaceomarginata]